MSPSNGPLRLGPRGLEAKAICVFVHGRGQSPEDMQSHVLSRLSAPDVAFILPRAPLGAWLEARAIDPLTSVARAQLSDALDHLAAAVVAARSELPGLPVLLAGFSQGACLAIEYICAGLPPPDALAAFTGCRIGVPSDVRSNAMPAGLPIYLSGSDSDPWIPISAFADTAQFLGSRGASLRADVFPGRSHEVSDAEIAMLGTILADLVTRQVIRMGAAR